MFENIYGNNVPCVYNIYYENMYDKFMDFYSDTQFGISPFGMRKEFDYPTGLLVPNYEEEDRILSIGAQDCMLSLYLSNHISDFYAIDLNNGFIDGEWLKSYTKSWGLNYSWGENAKLYIMNAANKLEFEDGFFDKIISISVLEHIMTKEYRVRVFQEMQRVLCSSGEIFLTIEFNPNQYVENCHRVGGSIFNLEYILEILEETDLEIINQLSYDVNWNELKQYSVYAQWFREIGQECYDFCPAYIHLRKK